MYNVHEAWFMTNIYVNNIRIQSKLLLEQGKLEFFTIKIIDVPTNDNK